MDPTKTHTFTSDGATLTVFPLGREVRLDGKLLRITRTEYALLETLMSHPERVYTYEALTQIIWNGFTGPRNLSQVAMRLRKKLDRHFINTIWGVGYRLTIPAESADSSA